MYGTGLDNSFSKAMKDRDNYYVLGQNELSEGALKIATVTYLDSNGLHLWTLEPDFPSVWNDAVVTPSGDLLVVGSTLPLDDSSLGLIGLVTPAGGGNFTWLRSYHEPETDRNAFIRIVKNPVPENIAFPYYILGAQSKIDDPSIVEHILLCMNANGGFSWKKKHESTDDRDVRDLKVFSGGQMLLAGNSRIEGHLGRPYIFITDNSGEMLTGVQFDGSNSTFTDIAVAANGEIYATLTTLDNHAQVMKFSSDLEFIWAEEIPQLTAATQIWAGASGEISIIGTGNFQGSVRQAKAHQLGFEAVWLRYPESGSSSNAGSFWPMPNGQIAFTDSRNIEGGFGQNEAFISLSDAELNTCNIGENNVSNQFFTPFGSSPVLPVTVFQEIPVGNDFTIFQALDWEQAVVCNPLPCSVDFTYDVDCGIVSFTGQSSFPNPISWEWTFAGGSPSTSTTQNPVVSFTACDSYKVCLTVTGGDPSTSCSICHTVTISDNVSPVALCLGIGIVLNANCEALITPQLIDGGSSDDCLIQSMSVSPEVVHGCGLFPVTLSVTDWCGNISTCSTFVQANEDIPPIIRCPSNVTVTAMSPSPCSKVINNLQPTFFSDNCGIPSITYVITGATTGSGISNASGSSFNEGISSITYTATDDCGNTAFCSFTVTVICSCECTNNLVQNGGFFEGAISGNLDNPGHSTDWFAGTQSPQIVIDDSCCDSTCVQMWGWLYNGESIFQQGVSFLAGHHYKVSFCGKFVQPNSYSNNVSFGFTAANSQISPFQCSTCDDIGSSPQIFNTSWNTYTLPIWTPAQNFNNFYIRAFNTQGIKSWGRIDNICIQEVIYTCCADQTGFAENIKNAVHVRFDESTQEGIFEVGNLPECDSIAYIDWGDGHITDGPFGGNTTRRNRFLDHILARINYQAQEFNQEVIPNAVCFENLFSDSIDVIGLDTCICNSFSELFLRGPHGLFNHLVECGEATDTISCLSPGAGYILSGILNCSGNQCADEPNVNWTLSGPGISQTGNVSSGPYFGIELPASYFQQAGLYTLSLTGQCGGQTCACSMQFFLESPCSNVCPCASQDVSSFASRVERGFAEVYRDNSCNVCFAPVALQDCETVEWHLNSIDEPVIGNSVGNETFCYQFNNAGDYNVVMSVSKKKDDGSNCDKQKRIQGISPTCVNLSACNNSVFENPTFSEGAVQGGLNTVGHSNGWKASSGNPKLLESQIGSLDGWTVFLSGNIDTSDILSTVEPICLTKIEGMIRVRIAVNDSAPGGIRGKPTKEQFDIELYQGNQIKPNSCDGISCYELASVSLRGLPHNEWLELRIPYNLRDWDAFDTCGGFPGVLVRPAMYVTNPFSNDQGGQETFTYVQIDNFCLDGTVVAVEEPEQKNNDISIFPNPTTGEIILQFKGSKPKTGVIQILDLYGRIMFTEKLIADKERHSLTIATLPPGLYFVNVLVKGIPIWHDKVIKQ